MEVLRDNKKKETKGVGSLLKAIMFDWDGTLYDSVILNYKSYLAVMKAFDLPQITIDEFRAKARPNYHEFYLLLGIEREDWETADRIWMDYYTKNKPGCNLFNGAVRALTQMKKMHLKIGLVSSGSRARVTPELCNEELCDMLDVMVFGDDVEFKKGKPEPDTLILAIKKVYLKPQDVLYVGDMAEDVQMGKKAGTKTAAVLSGFATFERLKRTDPDVIVDDVSCLPEVVKNLYDN
jgi:phosphoglycolate phosphatase-like HAD superfamily hydrolase